MSKYRLTDQACARVLNKKFQKVVRNISADGSEPLSRVETWRGGARRSVSTSRSSNRTGGFPASGSRRRRHVSAHERPALPRAEVNQTQLLVQVLAGEQGLHPGVHLVLMGQPPTQPPAGVLFHRPVGPADDSGRSLVGGRDQALGLAAGGLGDEPVLDAVAAQVVDAGLGKIFFDAVVGFLEQ